jgi:hypothetical protein
MLRNFINLHWKNYVFLFFTAFIAVQLMHYFSRLQGGYFFETGTKFNYLNGDYTRLFELMPKINEDLFERQSDLGEQSTTIMAVQGTLISFTFIYSIISYLTLYFLDKKYNLLSIGIIKFFIFLSAHIIIFQIVLDLTVTPTVSGAQRM